MIIARVVVFGKLIADDLATGIRLVAQCPEVDPEAYNSVVNEIAAIAMCRQCGEPATVQVHDKTGEVTGLYCQAHEPAITPGKDSHLLLVRSRLPPKNALSEAFLSPVDSPRHEALRMELCETKLLGNDGACQYYLSRITGIDHFALWSDEYVQNAREVIKQASPFVDEHFHFDLYTVGS